MMQDNTAEARAARREEELRLRLFWTELRLYRASVQRGHRMKIVFLGFDRSWEALLTGALQYNIFDPEQRIEYHVFGDPGGYGAAHTQLAAVSDPVLFHAGPWQERRELLEEAALVLCLGGIGAEAALPAAATLSDPHRSLDARQRARCGVLLERAKRINLRYAHRYGGVPETAEAREEQWRRLDDFARGSNLCSAIYHEVRLEMLAAMGEDPDRVSPACMELLTVLEHIRWCRYHYLNNWRQGTPENGKNKDMLRRVHEDLIPYGELSEEDKEKDRENIRMLLSLR